MTEEKNSPSRSILGEKISNTDELPSQELKEMIASSIGYFDANVDFLRDGESFPNPRINSLMDLFFNLTNSEFIPLVIDEDILFPMFCCEKKEWGEEVAFLIPINFADLYEEDADTQLVRLVHAASLVRDFYNNCLDSEEDSRQRALAYGAEFLLTLREEDPEFIPDYYHKEILEAYPQGLESLPPELRYASMPFFSVEAV